MQFGTEVESRTASAVDFVACQSLTLQQLSTTRENFANIVSGVFTPVLAKHTKSFNLIDAISVRVDRIQRDFSRCSARLRRGGRQKSLTRQRS
jgi:hypothetical protein